MLQLEALTREAADLGANRPRGGGPHHHEGDHQDGPGGLRPDRNALSNAAEEEVARVMQICNACRYCEGFCAVFPAMTHRLAFHKNDIHFLANLCHNCGACLHACQYAPPHEFAVNVPQAMAKVRLETYTEYAWPQAFGVLYKKNGLTLAVALAIGLAVFLILAMEMAGTPFGVPVGNAPGNFYAIFPHNMLAAMFGVVFLLAILALGIGTRRFWRTETAGPFSAGAGAAATHDALTLRYLGGGHGEGCNNEDDAFSLARRRFHHLTFYGFMLCFASTCVATLYHYLFAWEAPYAFDSVPVILGTLGGIGLLIGPAGLLYLNIKRHRLQGDAAQKPMDRGFIMLLLLVSVTGLLLLVGRAGPWMSLLLPIHLASVMALFLTLPYGKFAHGILRCAALLKWEIEKRHPPKLEIGAD